jgi:hypothetical protein
MGANSAIIYSIVYMNVGTVLIYLGALYDYISSVVCLPDNQLLHTTVNFSRSLD